MKRTANEHRDRMLRIALPVIVLALGVAIWEIAVRAENIPAYVLPSPSLILKTLIADWTLLSQSLLVTFATNAPEFVGELVSLEKPVVSVGRRLPQAARRGMREKRAGAGRRATGTRYRTRGSHRAASMTRPPRARGSRPRTGA